MSPTKLLESENRKKREGEAGAHMILYSSNVDRGRAEDCGIWVGIVGGGAEGGVHRDVC